MIDTIAYKTFFSLCANRCFSDRRLNTFIYHRVLKQHDPLQPDIVTETEFDQQMQWAAKYFNVLPMHKAAELQESNQLPPRSLAITFDDGYRDNAEVALPILEKYNLHASFYITQNYLKENPKWDNLTESIRATKLNTIEFFSQSYPLASDTEKAQFLRSASEKIKSFPEEKANEILANTINLLGDVDVPFLMMDEDIVKQLPSHTIEVGGHGVNHFILSKVSDESAKNEIVQSKHYLENLISRDVKGFAYPNGLYPEDLHDLHAQMVKDAGYQYAVTTNIGTTNASSNPYLLNRYTPWRRHKMGFLAEVGVNYWRA